MTFDQTPPDRIDGPTILIVDDGEVDRDRVALLCTKSEEGRSFLLLRASNLFEAFGILASKPVHVVLLDKDLGPPGSESLENGIDAIPEMLRMQPHLQILMLTASQDIDDVVRAMQLGAFGYARKQSSDALLLAQITKAVSIAKLSKKRIQAERLFRQRESRIAELGGKSPVFQRIQIRARAVAESSRPVLLLGESGTGKTEQARQIHLFREEFLKQHDRPFVPLNMAAFSSDLADRELFGNEAGAFTDARKDNPGLIEIANGGTLFLDEIGEASLELQAKLLKVLEEGKFYRLGGTKVYSSSFKLICATNRDIEAMVANKLFREDLYMRISTFTIRIPSISERKEDIPDIIRTILPTVCAQNGAYLHYDDLPVDFIDYLMNHPIPGNIRGIERYLSRLLVFSPRDRAGRPILRDWQTTLEIPNIRIPVRSFGHRQSLSLNDLMTLPVDAVGPNFPGHRQVIQSISDRLIQDARSKCDSISSMARMLKLPKSTLAACMKRTKKTEGIANSKQSEPETMPPGGHKHTGGR